FLQNFLTQNSQAQGLTANVKFRYYHVKGHLAVIQVGVAAYGIDMHAGNVLWQHLLYDPTKFQGPNNNWQFTLEQGRIVVLHLSPNGGATKVRVGEIGTVQATYVALVTQKGL